MTTDSPNTPAPWMQLVAHYGGDAERASDAVVTVRGVRVEVGRRMLDPPSLFVTSNPVWVTWAEAAYAGPAFEVRESTAFESVLEGLNLLRELTLGDEHIDGLFVVRGDDLGAMQRLWTDDARNRLKSMSSFACSVRGDGKRVHIDVVEESAELALLVSMVELIAELAQPGRHDATP